MELGTLILTIGGFCGAISTTIALIILIIKPIRNKFVSWVGKTADTDGINKKIDRLTELVETTVEQNKELKAEMNKQSEALKASIRNSILNLYYKCLAKGYITTFELQNVSELYANYKSLGGNSFISKVVDIMVNTLPVKD